MRAPFAIVRAARACASTALVLLACSDEAGNTGGDDAATGGMAGAGGASGGASGSTGIGGGKGGGRGGGAGTTAAGAGSGGTSGASGDAGAGMGGEGGMDDGGEGGEGAVAGSGAGMAGSSMGGNAMGGAGTTSGGMSGASGTSLGGAGNGGAGNGGAGNGGAGNGGAGNGGGSVGGTGVGGAGAGGAGAGGAGAGGAGAGGAGAGGAGAGGAGAGGAGAGGAGAGGAGAGGGTSITWETRVLATDHVAEGADVGDIDGDGVIDLVAGPRWYKGPGFALGGTLMANPPTFTRDNYSTFFLTFVDDLNGDNRPDVIAVGDAGGGNGTGNPNTSWYQNPGPGNFGQAWTKTGLYTAGSGYVANESPAYLDLLGDGRRELVFMTGTRLGYATRGATPTTGWAFTPVTPNGNPSFANYTHGLGVGDIDGDGLRDIVERTGWWRQIAAATWERHAFDFGAALGGGRASNWGGAQMYIYDIDGDGDNDVVSGLFAHRYGISWFERQGTGASATFVPHAILPITAGTGNFSQAHAMAIADVNGDGLTDFIAGKRYYAHPTGNLDPGSGDMVVLYWFELRRSGGTATFTPHLIHSASGAGCNFVARDLTGDGKVDIFTTNKFGTYLHVQR